MRCQHSARQAISLLVACFFLQLLIPAANAQEPQPAGDIPSFMEGWLGAWQAQDLDAYFQRYHPEFEPAGFSTLDEWRASRTRNISRPDEISIVAETLDIIPGTDNSTATVRFWFVYRSNDYADRTWKEVSLALTAGGDWAITAERNLEVQGLPVNPPQADAGAQPDSVNALPDAVDDIQPDPIDNTEAAAPSPDEEDSSTAEAGVDLSQGGAEEAAIESPVPDGDNAESADVASAPDTGAQTAPASSVSREEWVPPGFENLNQPQVTEIDVFYGGFYLTSVLAEFSDRDVTFLDKDTLMDGITNLKDPDAFRQLLNKSFNAHPELLCFSDFQVDCGTLETDSVEVIFDRSRLRLWLFISPDLLLSATNDQLRFLPESEAGLSFLNQTALFFSGEDTDIDNYNLFNNTLFAWRENRLSMRSNLISEEGFEVDTLALMREFRGKDYRLGLMRESANGFSFMANERFEGMAFASSLLTRTDLEQSLGTEIELFFSTRSRVEIYQEGRLISTDYYNVGNSILDTSALPNGSYTIEIRVIDASGNITTEERYYSKTARIAPADQPLYFLHAGKLQNDMDINRLSVTGEDTFVRGGLNLRLGQTLGGNLGFSVVDDTRMIEAGLFKQGQSYELQANTAYEDNGASGIDLRMRYRHPLFSLTVNTRQVFNGEEDSQIGLDYNQYYTMLEVPTSLGYLSVFHRDVERPLTGSNTNTGLRFRTRGRELGGGNLNTNFEVSKNGDGVIALLTFSYQLQGNNRSSTYEPKVSYANEASSRDSGLYGSYQSSWYTGQQTGSEYRLSVRGDYDYQNSMEARFESNTDLGSSDVVARYNGQTRNMELSGRLSTSYATNGETSAFGGKRRSESAFLVRVGGDPDSGARFEVMINGVARGELAAEETLMVPVSPYLTYEVELRSIGDTLVSLENRVYRETMYPGNVVNLSWETRVISIAIGRILDEDNEPLANALVQNVVGIAITDENGFFQAEIDQNTDQLELLKGDFSCEVAIDNPGTGETVLSLGTLQCL